MDILTEFDELQEALKKVKLDEDVMIYHNGMLLENQETASQINKLLNCNEMVNCHRYLLDIDKDDMQDDEIDKVGRLYDLAVKKGYIDNSFNTDCDCPPDTECVCVSGECDCKPVTQTTTTDIKPATSQVKIPCWTVLYSAMNNNGNASCGECYSNAINVQSAKADAIAKLTRCGYSNVEILAIEASDPDCCCKTEYYGDDISDDKADISIDEKESTKKTPLCKGNACNKLNTKLNEREPDYDVNPDDEVVSYDDDLPDDGAIDNIWNGKKYSKLDLEPDFNDPEYEERYEPGNKDDDLDEAEKELIKEFNFDFGEKKPACKNPLLVSENFIKPIKRSNPLLVAENFVKPIEISNPLLIAENFIQNSNAPMSAAEFFKTLEEDDAESESDDQNDVSDDSDTNNSDDSETPSDDSEDTSDDSETTSDDSEDTSDDSETPSDDSETTSDDPADDSASTEQQADDTGDSNSEDDNDSELSDQEKSSLTAEYSKAFKDTMIKCGFTDRIFNELTIEEKIKFFTELSKIWQKNEPFEFMPDAEIDQLNSTVFGGTGNIGSDDESSSDDSDGDNGDNDDSGEADSDEESDDEADSDEDSDKDSDEESDDEDK